MKQFFGAASEVYTTNLMQIKPPENHAAILEATLAEANAGFCGPPRSAA